MSLAEKIAQYKKPAQPLVGVVQVFLMCNYCGAKAPLCKGSLWCSGNLHIFLLSVASRASGFLPDAEIGQKPRPARENRKVKRPSGNALHKFEAVFYFFEAVFYFVILFFWESCLFTAVPWTIGFQDFGLRIRPTI